MGTVTAESYTLKDDRGYWLGQVVLTSDGMFASVTDYGNFSFAWRSYGDMSFKEFLIGLGEDYFATKMACGMAYVLLNKKIDQGAERFAKMILPALQKVLREELGK